MKTAVLSVGTEILFGQIVNTNTAFLSQQLNLLGFNVLYHYSVGDNPGRLRNMLDRIFEECELVIITGGLGPTEDDLTKEIVCEAFGDELEMHEESLQHLHDIAKRRGRKMTPNNFKQAMMPKSAFVFANDAGSAPGFAIEKEGKIAICMPGPPREMKRMWEKKVVPYLSKYMENSMYYRIIRTFGIGESSLETALLELIDSQSDPTIATYAKEGECSIRVASMRKSMEEAEAAVESMIQEIEKIVGEYVYSTEDEDINTVVGKLLIEKNISISLCESCTGGLLAEKLIEVSGISKVLDRGIVTYSHKAKREELGVKQETLDKYTAESRETAEEMVLGLKEKTGSDICISVTGVAGPDDIGDNPAGHIFIGISFDGVTDIKEVYTHRNDRNWNRNYIYLYTMMEIYKLIR